MVFTTNRAGCTFPGRPLVEGTRTLHNYDIQAKNLHMDNLQAYMEAGRQAGAECSAVSKTAV